MNQQVEYRDIDGHPGYQVGNDGSVWRTRNLRTGKTRKEVHFTINDKGYRRVCLTRPGGKRQWWFSHRLVLWAFVGPCPRNCETRHLDGNPANNAVDNLAWGTRQENLEDKKRHGTYFGRGRAFGEKNGSAKLTENIVREIRKMHADGIRRKDIAAAFRIHRSTVLDVTTGRYWGWVD